MPFVLFMVGLCIGLVWFSTPNHHAEQWVAECHSKGGAAVYVYTDAFFTQRINCLDAKRVDMKDNEP